MRAILSGEAIFFSMRILLEVLKRFFGMNFLSSQMSQVKLVKTIHMKSYCTEDEDEYVNGVLWSFSAKGKEKNGG